MKPSIFGKPDGGKLELGAHALGRMLAFVQDTSRKKEAGGVLLGRQILESADVVVDEVTMPMQGDRRYRARFYRDRRRHQEVIDRAWRESSGTCTYLGEWHTHPEPRPTSSAYDLREWQRKLREDTFAGDTLHFAIVGTRTLRVWVGDQRTLDCTPIGEFDYQGVDHGEDQGA